MALKPIEILKDVIEGDSHTITIDSVTSLGSSQYKLSTENTLYLRTEKQVTIDGVVYRVVDFSINSYVTVAAKDGSDTPVTASSFDINPPLFLWGNPKMVSAELDVRKKNKSTQIYPYIWLVDIHNTSGTTSPSAAVKRTPNFTLLFLDSIKYEKWTIEDHYDQDVYPLNNYLDYFFAILESRRDLFETDDIDWTSVNVVNFGDYVIDKGMQERILTDNCTGISLQINLPIIQNDCQDIDVNRSCPAGNVSNSDDTYSATVPSGGTLELPDINVTDSDGSSTTVPAQTAVVCTPCAGGLPVETTFNGAATSNDTPAGDTLAIAVINTTPSLVGTLITDTANSKGIQIADASMSLESVPFAQGVAAEGTMDIQLVDSSDTTVASTVITDGAGVKKIEVAQEYVYDVYLNSVDTGDNVTVDGTDITINLGDY